MASDRETPGPELHRLILAAAAERRDEHGRWPESWGQLLHFAAGTRAEDLEAFDQALLMLAERALQPVPACEPDRPDREHLLQAAAHLVNRRAARARLGAAMEQYESQVENPLPREPANALGMQPGWEEFFDEPGTDFPEREQPRGTGVIARDPEILGGRAVFRGTRVPVAVLFENLEDGMAIDEILASYPSLNRDDILECLREACAVLAGERP